MSDSITDVFVRIHHLEMCCDKTGIRAGMSQAVLARWLAQKDCRLEEIFGGEGPDFHIASKKAAELNAISSIYVIADADCLILGKDFISKGVSILEAHPQYGLLSATSICDGMFPAGQDIPQPEVVELHAVGGIAFVRKGILTEFRDCRPDQVDGTICDEINRKGFKTGAMPHVRFNHLGSGYSLSTKGLWLT